LARTGIGDGRICGGIGMPVDKKFWSGALVVVTVVVAGAGTLPALLLRSPVSEAPDLVTQAAVSAPASLPVVVKPPEVLLSNAVVLPLPVEPPKRVERPVAAEVSPAALAAAPAAVAAVPAAVAAQPAAVAAQPAPPVPQPVPAAVVAVPAAVAPVPAAVPAATTAAPAASKQVAFPPVQPVDAPSAAPQPAGTDAAKKAARQAQIAAVREAKRKQQAMRPQPYSIRDFFASTR
jgi:translation initiation factor IF-3